MGRGVVGGGGGGGGGVAGGVEAVGGGGGWEWINGDSRVVVIFYSSCVSALHSS